MPTLGAFASTCSAAAPASGYGRIVSQSYDSAQQITETDLANGLVVLTREVHSAPVVEVRVVYKVGSHNEISGQTGLSHILEHMMFKGTTTLPAGAIDYLFRQAGADNNAQTDQDTTQYHELVQSNRLEPMIRLEADRMENSAFRPNDLASEMTVVRSELEGDVNDPDYELYSFGLLPAAFSANSYRWPAIGYVSDVEAVQHNRALIYRYYKQHYMPNNAVVVLVGDFKSANAVALCQKYFGSYAPGTLEQHHITPEPKQTGERRTVLQRPGTTGELLVAFHDPGLGTDDHYTMDVIGTILSGGVSARLYQDMVATGLAQSAGMDDPDMKDPYLDIFDAVPQAGVGLDKLEGGIEAEITKLQTAPVSQAELQQAINQIDANFVYQRDSIDDQSENIGNYAGIASYKYDDTYLRRIGQVTPAMIQAVAQKYFTATNRTVARFEPVALPPGQTLPPPPSGEHFGSRQSSSQQAAAFSPIAQSYGLSSFAPAKVTEKPTRVVLPNGMVLIVQENHSNPDVAIAGYVKAGSVFDTNNKQVSSMTAEMLGRGTQTKTYLQLAQQLESVGASADIAPGLQTVSIDGQCLTHDFSLTVDTLADELTHPSFPQDQLTKLIQESYSGLEQARQDTGSTGGAGTLADIAFARALYPAGHPFSSPTLDEIEAQTRSMTRDQLAGFYQKYYRPDSAVLVVVGDVTPQQAETVVENAFGGWAKPASSAPQIVIPDVAPPATAPAPELLSLADATQTSILYGFPGELKRTDKDYYATVLANYVLGGDVFAARLGHEIRDVDGLTYTVYSSFSASLGAGPFEVFAGTNPANANRTLDAIRRITTNFAANGATPEELRQAKTFLTGAYPATLSTNDGVASLLVRSELYGLGLDYPNRYLSILNDVTLAQVNAAAKRHLVPDRAAVILSGATPR